MTLDIITVKHMSLLHIEKALCYGNKLTYDYNRF